MSIPLHEAFRRWLVLAVAYLLLADHLTGPETVAAVVTAILGTVAMLLTARVGALHFRARFRWLAPLSRIPMRILADCGTVAAALVRALRGRPDSGEFIAVPFDPGGGGAESTARRALVVAGVSAAPNTYVVGIDHERNLVLLHRLVHSAAPPGGGDREWPL